MKYKFQKSLLLLVSLTVLLVAGCGPYNLPYENVKFAEVKCINNGGIKYILIGLYDIKVICTNDMETSVLYPSKVK